MVPSLCFCVDLQLEGMLFLLQLEGMLYLPWVLDNMFQPCLGILTNPMEIDLWDSANWHHQWGSCLAVCYV